MRARPYSGMVETSRPNSPSLARYRAAISSIGIWYLARVDAMGRRGVDAMGRLIVLRMRQDPPVMVNGPLRGVSGLLVAGRMGEPEPLVGREAPVRREELLEERPVLVRTDADSPDDVAPRAVEPP